jgi:hypothetical protein
MEILGIILLTIAGIIVIGAGKLRDYDRRIF